MAVLFLDIDGVLNDHKKLPGSVYCGIRADCMAELSRVIAATKCAIILSSSWRYLILSDSMTFRGFENMLFSHGLVAEPPVVLGCTRRDITETYTDRAQQILSWLTGSGFDLKRSKWAVVDDCPKGLDIDMGHHNWRLVKTDGTRGMTRADGDNLIEILGRVGG